MRIICALLKGGVCKTLTAVLICHLLALRGRRVLLIDCDPGSQSAFDWHALALSRGEPLPFDVLPWASLDLALKLPSLAPHYDDIIVDVGGGAREAEEMFKAACEAMGKDPDNPAELVIPCRPNLGDLRRIPATLEAASATQARTGAALYPRVLLSDVPTTTPYDEQVAREFLTSSSIPVFTSPVRHSVYYPRMFGRAIDDPRDFCEVFAELCPEVAATL